MFSFYEDLIIYLSLSNKMGVWGWGGQSNEDVFNLSDNICMSGVV